MASNLFGYTAPYAEIEWAEYGPRSADRSDVYFSKAGAIEEAQYIFLQGNNLAERFGSQRNVTVGELGFGFGLNFLLTWKAFEESGSGGFLLYLSCENTPVRPSDLRKFYAAFPDLGRYAERLLAVLPGNIRGIFRLAITPWVSLQLMIGDAEESLSGLRAGRIDAWYLDGFSSHVNPELWTASILQQVARLSGAGTSLASYSVASQFRRDLEACGFEVQKVPGFGFKREALRAKYKGGETLRRSPTDRVVIVGAGLAGAALVSAFGKRGVSTILLERGDSVAQGASGNPLGILMPHVSLQTSPESAFLLSGFFAALSEVSELICRRRVTGELSGVLRLCTSDRFRRLFNELDRLGLPGEFVMRSSEPSEALFFGRGGYLSPPELCQRMLEDVGSRVENRFGVRVGDIEPLGDSWRIRVSDGSVIDSETVVLGQGYEALPFLGSHYLSIEKVRGQIATLRQRSNSNEIKYPICYDGYITPAPQGVHLLGGTFDHNDDREYSDDGQTEDLLRRLNDNVPGLGFTSEDIVDTRVSFRAMTPDRLPIVGQLYNAESFEQAFRATGLRRTPEEGFLDGLYSITGLGSKGLISVHLAAEVVVSQILGEPSPLSKKLLDAIGTARFHSRAIKRGEITR